MARFLFTVWPFDGCIHPALAVAEALKPRGHISAFYTGSAMKNRVETQGFAHFAFDPLLEQHLNDLVYSADSIGATWRNAWKLMPRLRSAFVDAVPQQVADLRVILTEWAPDALICDPALWAPFLILSESENVPVALLSYVCGCMLPGPGAPPVGLGLPLPRTPYQLWRNRLIGAIQDLLMASARRAASDLRQQYGLPRLDGPVLSLTGRLPLYLLPSCPEFDYERRDLPPSVIYVGPLQWYPPRERAAWLDQLPHDRPWVHVTEGTLHVQEPFVLRAAAQGLANLPMQVILTTGGYRDPAALDLGPIAANVRVESWVSHADLLPHTSVLVTTAGAGTVMAALEAGVPMVLVPLEWDKAENAQRVVEAGAGVRLSRRQCTPKRLRQAVELLLTDPSFGRNAQRIAACLHGLAGPAQAAQYLEKMCLAS